ncbi:MAG: hypothetical protein LBG97_02990 [Coriobacteriales bacterium]|nr:hypothetical protein [Coriobacteriales bacterium]
MSRVFYNRLVEGQTVSAIIHNGSYFFQHMAVYEDGSVSCWKRVGLDELPEQLNKGWLVTEVPTGENLNVHGLGDFKIIAAEWMHTPESYVAHICDCVKQMNPDMEGLYKETRPQSQRWEKNRVSWSASPTPYKIAESFGYDISKGESTSLFYRCGEKLRLTQLTAFPDKTIAIDSLPGQWFSLHEIYKMFETGELTSSFEGKGNILLGELGAITAVRECGTSNDDKLMEIVDLLAKTSDEPTSHDRCKNAYYEYLRWPTEECRKRLQAAYEAVPEHERRYLGDMDSKDWDYRRIIYHPENKREV